jgi:hypothetical protein
MSAASACPALVERTLFLPLQVLRQFLESRIFSVAGGENRRTAGEFRE